MKLIVEEHSCETDKIKEEELTFLVASDIHGDIKSLLAVERYIEESGIDIDGLICPGDMYDKKENRDPVTDWFNRQEIPIYYSIGNHEEEIEPSKMEEEYKKLERMRHVTLLRKSYIPVQFKSTNVRISALNLPICYQALYNKSKKTFQDYANSIYKNTLSKSNYNLHLSHLPGYVVNGVINRAIRAVEDIDYITSGHMHYGIVPLGNHRGLLGPYASIMPNDAYGEYDEEDIKLLISGGLTPFAKSIEIPPLRLLNKVLPGRMSLINIKRKEPVS